MMPTTIPGVMPWKGKKNPVIEVSAVVTEEEQRDGVEPQSGQHAEQDDDAGRDSNEADGDVERGEGRERETEDHDSASFPGGIGGRERLYRGRVGMAQGWYTHPQARSMEFELTWRREDLSFNWDIYGARVCAER